MRSEARVVGVVVLDLVPDEIPRPLVVALDPVPAHDGGKRRDGGRIRRPPRAAVVGAIVNDDGAAHVGGGRGRGGGSGVFARSLVVLRANDRWQTGV